MSAPTPFVPGARAAFTLGIETTLASRRAWLTGLLLGLPALLAVAYRVAAASGVELHLTGWQVYGDFAVTLYWVGLALPTGSGKRPTMVASTPFVMSTAGST